MRVDPDALTDEHIWRCAAFAVKWRDVRLLGYCDAALRGGKRREEAARRAICKAINDALEANARAGKE